MEYLYDRSIIPALNALRRAGGKRQKAALSVEALIGRIVSGDQAPFEGMKITKHGETRIAHCVKYDLGDYCRLVTVQNNGVCYLVFVGSHEQADRWLDQHRGLTLCKGKDGHWTLVEQSASLSAQSERIEKRTDWAETKLVAKILPKMQDKLLAGVSPSLIGPIFDLDTSTTPKSIYNTVCTISDPLRQTMVYDALVLLLNGDVDGACRRIDLYFRDVRPLDDLSPEEVISVNDGDQVRRLRIGSIEYQKWIDSFIRSSSYYDWFLFLHPEQEKFVVSDYDGPAKLSGVSGSGKTCISVRRAIRLAESAEGPVLILTLNRSLACLIRLLVEAACPFVEIRKRIVVRSFFELCQSLLAEFEPENLRQYSDVTWKLGEHIDEIFREYYRCMANVYDAEVLLPIHRALTAQSIDAEQYIRDEFDWIRSAVPPSGREIYLDVERIGRNYPISSDRRKLLLDGLAGWEKKMHQVGAIDYLGLTTALSRHTDKIEPRYSHIVVDEVQDFGTMELRVVRKLVRPGRNDLFLCGDLAQHILPKHQSFLSAGIEVAGRGFTIRRNYRNTREILKAAYAVLIANLDEPMIDRAEVEILDPEYANRSGTPPIVLRADDLQDEIMYARKLIQENAENNSEHRGCIAIAGYSLFEVAKFGARVGIPVLDGSQDPRPGTVFFSDLEQTKGYEFDTMIVVNCAKDVLPPSTAPNEEVFRYGCQLYVAMTRARNQLVLSYSGEPSEWLSTAGQAMHFDEWSANIIEDRPLAIGRPERLPELDSTAEDDDLGCTGRQFVYTRWALGLSQDAQQKLSEIVDGRGLRRGNRRVKWRTMRDLADDMGNSPHARGVLGTRTYDELKAVMARLSRAKGKNVARPVLSLRG